MTETQEIILNALAELCKKYPQQRLGQIIYNYLLAYCPWNDPFYLEDKKILEILEKALDNISH